MRTPIMMVIFLVDIRLEVYALIIFSHFLLYFNILDPSPLLEQTMFKKSKVGRDDKIRILSLFTFNFYLSQYVLAFTVKSYRVESFSTGFKMMLVTSRIRRLLSKSVRKLENLSYEVVRVKDRLALSKSVCA